MGVQLWLLPSGPWIGTFTFKNLSKYSRLSSWQSMNPGYFSCPVCTSSQIIFVCDTNARQCRNYTRNLVQIKIRHWIIQDQPHYWILSKWNSNLLLLLFLNHMIFSRFENFSNFEIFKCWGIHFELCDRLSHDVTGTTVTDYKVTVIFERLISWRTAWLVTVACIKPSSHTFLPVVVV